MMTFRVIFDRVYEKRKRLGAPNPHDESGLLGRLAILPTRLYEFPLGGLTPEDLSLPIRDYFKKEHFFASASEFLKEIVFVTNPVDALYFVYRALRLINKAALLKTLQAKGEVKQADLNKLLGFDDLFAFLVGVLMASDIPNFFEIASFIDAFSPKNCLSNSFEFAMAAISALTVHLPSLTVASDVV
jgi:hypothetical protein